MVVVVVLVTAVSLSTNLTPFLLLAPFLLVLYVLLLGVNGIDRLFHRVIYCRSPGPLSSSLSRTTTTMSTRTRDESDYHSNDRNNNVSNSSSTNHSKSSKNNKDSGNSNNSLEMELHLIEPCFIQELFNPLPPAHVSGNVHENQGPTHENKGPTHENKGPTHENKGLMHEYQGLIRVAILYRMSLTSTYPKHLWFQGSLPILQTFRQVINVTVMYKYSYPTICL